MSGYTTHDRLRLEGAIREIITVLHYSLSPDLTGTVELTFPFREGKIAGTIWIATKERHPERKRKF